MKIINTFKSETRPQDRESRKVSIEMVQQRLAGSHFLSQAKGHKMPTPTGLSILSGSGLVDFVAEGII